MNGYGPAFARLYNQRWSSYAARIAPLLDGFYSRISISQSNRTILDLCCGTGQLAQYFLARGYTVVGVDLSEHMLLYAIENTRSYIRSGQAQFILGDVVNLPLRAEFGLVVSTYYSLNHLENDAALERCFACAYANLATNGYLIFDFSTRLGELRWNTVRVEWDADAFVLRSGYYDGEGRKSRIQISGFLRKSGELYEHFDVSTFNCVHALAKVRNMLLEQGCSSVHFALGHSLDVPLKEPEEEKQVFVVALTNLCIGF